MALISRALRLIPVSLEACITRTKVLMAIGTRGHTVASVAT